MKQCALKNVNNCLNTNIYSCLETSSGQSSNPYLNVVHFSTPVLIRCLWQLKTVVFLHRCLIHTLLLKPNQFVNGTAHIKNVHNCLNTNIYSYLETSGGQSSNLYLNVVHFFNTRVN
jgi:hypothetical protein